MCVLKMKWRFLDDGGEPAAPLLTSWLDSGLGTETLETVKCGTGGGVSAVSTWEEISDLVSIWSNQQSLLSN